jgi:hypothetical protein
LFRNAAFLLKSVRVNPATHLRNFV